MLQAPGHEYLCMAPTAEISSGTHQILIPVLSHIVSHQVIVCFFTATKAVVTSSWRVLIFISMDLLTSPLEATGAVPLCKSRSYPSVDHVGIYFGAKLEKAPLEKLVLDDANDEIAPRTRGLLRFSFNEISARRWQRSQRVNQP